MRLGLSKMARGWQATLRLISSYPLNLILVLVAFLLSVLVVRPFGQFPLNDEWAYGIPVQQLLFHGRLLYPLSTAFALTQVLSAVPICALLGFSYPVLRMLGIFFGLAAIVLFFYLSRELGLSRRDSGIFSLVFASNPFFISLSNSFMTDVPSMTLLIGMMLFLVRACKSNSSLNWFFAGLFFCLAIANRQTSVLLFPSIVCVLVMLYFLKRKILVPFFFLLILPTACYLICSKMFYTCTLFAQPTLDYQAAIVSRIVLFLQQPISRFEVFWEGVGKAFCYLGLFCIPLLVPMSLGALKTQSRTLVVLSLSFGMLAVGIPLMVITLWKGQYMPFSVNLFFPPWLGAYCLAGPGEAPILQSPWIEFITLISCLAAVLLSSMFLPIIASFCGCLLRLFSISGIKKSGLTISAVRALVSCFLLVSFITITAFLSIQVDLYNLDRYYFVLYPFALCLLALPWRSISANSVRTFCVVLALVAGIVGTVQCLDNHNFCRAREKCIAYLRESGVPEGFIDGGPEYNFSFNWGLLAFNKFPGGYLPASRGTPITQKYRWWPITSEKYIVASGELPGYERIFAVHYFSPILGEKRWVYGLKQVE